MTVTDGEAFIDFYSGKLNGEAANEIGQAHARFHGTRTDVVNSGFRWKHQHFYMYDGETFRKLLEEIGFVKVERQEFGESAVAELGRLDSAERRIGTLYMEGSKPSREGERPYGSA